MATGAAAPAARSLSPSDSLASSSSNTDADGDSIINDAAGATATGTATSSELLEYVLGAVRAGGGGGHPAASSSSARQRGAKSTPLPAGPVLTFGPRLGYTYFAQPAPRAEALNALTPGREGEGGEEGIYWFSVDDQLLYLSFFQDYGPLNVGCLYRFCLHLHSLLSSPDHAHQRIFLYSSDEPDKKVNAAVLMALYAMVVMRWSVADVLHPLSSLELQPYRDAGYSRADYHLHPQSLLYGIHRALSHSLLDLSTFDLAAYEQAEKVETGDWNWITPGFVAFASPVESGYREGVAQGGAGGAGGAQGGSGKLSRAFRNVLDEFEKKGVKVVVRLNKKLYDASHFTSRGIDHVEMYFDDGTNPTLDMCRRFIDLSDRIISAGGAVAVHCKAGLGRTGTLIGAYLIYKHGFTADEAIGFMRLMRPGSCVGPQQHFLYENQFEWVRWAAQDELRRELESQRGLVGKELAAAGAGAVASTSTAGEAVGRPLTPPNEADLDRARSKTPSASHGAPVTPRRQTGNVPGQPRKTPGRSRHAVAEPERVSPEEKSALEEEERMEGVVLSSPRKGRSSGGGAGAKGKGKGPMLDAAKEDDEEDDPLAMVVVPSSPRKLGLAPPARINGSATASTSSARPPPPALPKTPTQPQSTRPTRIARPATRPLSALADNRIVDRIGTTRSSTRIGGGGTTTASAGGAAGMARSKAAKNLNTVFEATTGGAGAGAAGQTRYPLRNGRTTSAGSTSSSTSAGLQPPNSPSKLPQSQRVLGKRDTGGPGRGNGGAANGGSAATANGGFNPAAAAAAGVAGGNGAGLGRNVRRRRSSMGSQETVNAG